MSIRSACNDDGGDGSFSDADPGGQGADQTASQRQSYDSYADFPGDELVYYDSEYDPIGLRVKAVGSQWVTEFLDSTAAPGSHHLVIYLVVTGELDDRGKDNAGLATSPYSTGLRFEPTVDDCKSEFPRYDEKYCYLDEWETAVHSAQLEPLASNDWPNYLWVDGMVMGVSIEAGQTMVGAVSFTIADNIDAVGDFEFCARGKDNTLDDDKFPCIAVPAPDPRS